MASEYKGKNSWPELVGVDGQAAATKIERESCHVNAIILLDGTLVTFDFRCDRVRVWVDHKGKVIREPQIG
ncbi:glu S.griseus protease inhibitor-like [Magnolia sinica]|uniref:glu S.griseus protease inhibitor-like n=1 Tax=Magnolia sinica TaxID=86752 RepID=UPI00265A6C4F|nr:glu S.griseus protease inhibitor-like [Magnolia sinica]